MSADSLSVELLAKHMQSGTLPLEVLIGHAERLQSAGRPMDAAALYKTWITHHHTPARCVAQFNLGVLLAANGDLDGAEAAYQDAVTANPKLYQAYINAGLVAERKGRPEDAIERWLDVASMAETQADGKPFATIALNHVGRLQESRRQYAAAEEALAHSLQLDPAQPDAIQHWVHLRQKQCAWPVYTPPPGLTMNALLSATSPLAMLALLDDPAMQWHTAASFVRRKYAPPESPRPQPRARVAGADQRLAIGYLSGDLCTHAVGLLLAELLEAHDRTAVRVVAFDFSPEDGTAHRARLRDACDEMVDVRRLDDHAAAAAIRDRGIDVLIDLHGLSSGARPGILALRPAPQIGTFLGFIGTTALPWVDFVVTDTWTLPEGLTPYVTERPLYIDGAMIPLHHQPVVMRGLTRADVGLPTETDAVVLACFNNIYKVTPAMFASWLRILRRADRAVLWLLDDNQWATATLKRHASAAGIDPARIIFAGRSTHAEYRERLTLADVYLDTFPYNAGSTARDVLDAGVPLVTLSGQTPVSRMAGGLLHAAGLDDLITTTVDAYEQRVVDLATSPDAVGALKARMQGMTETWRQSPARMIRSLEAQLRSGINSSN